MLDQLLKGALQGLAGNQGSGQALLQLAASLLSSNGQFGGIAGLIQQFQRAGLGAQMQSWISTGQNLPISPQQLAQVFGADQMQQMARQTGLTPDAFGSQFSQLLPQLIDQLTPQGRVPDNGLDDALGALAKFLR